MAGLVGAERVLFASDYPLMDPSRPLMQAKNAALSPEDEVALLYGNAANLLGL